MFHKIIGLEKVSLDRKMKYREAVRAIIMKGNRILLVHNNRGDYKFPGGGVEAGETHVQAIQREVAEETGYLHCKIREKFCVVIERNLDLYEEDTVFEMTSHYFFCEISGERVQQQLDDYEAEQEFTPVWVDIDEAIEQNEVELAKSSENRWIYRENAVLKEIKRQYIGE